MQAVRYRIRRADDGWHATALDDTPTERIFVRKAEALAWCKQHAQCASIAAAPEEGAYGEITVEITE